MEKSNEEKGMKVSVCKTKAFCAGAQEIYSHSAKFPCSVCGKGVGRNSMKCTNVQNGCIRDVLVCKTVLKLAVSFVCKRCLHLVHANRDERVTLDGNDLEVVDKFPYLGDVLSSAEGVQEAVTARIRPGWKKFQEISYLQCKQGLSLKMKGTIYKKLC